LTRLTIFPPLKASTHTKNAIFHISYWFQKHLLIIGLTCIHFAKNLSRIGRKNFNPKEWTIFMKPPGLYALAWKSWFYTMNGFLHFDIFLDIDLPKYIIWRIHSFIGIEIPELHSWKSNMWSIYRRGHDFLGSRTSCTVRVKQFMLTLWDSRVLKDSEFYVDLKM
jgi:hypothetical protein